MGLDRPPVVGARRTNVSLFGEITARKGRRWSDPQRDTALHEGIARISRRPLVTSQARAQDVRTAGSVPVYRSNSAPRLGPRRGSRTQIVEYSRQGSRARSLRGLPGPHGLPARIIPGSDLSERHVCASDGRFRGGRSRPEIAALKGSHPSRTSD